MNSDETLALWARGKQAWNAWAEERLAQQDSLRHDDHWSVDWFGAGQNAQSTAWVDAARADFSGHDFTEAADFAGYIFPGPVDFGGATFHRDASFAGARFASTARFAKARFDGAAQFDDGQFQGITDFDDAAFNASANFSGSHFALSSEGPMAASLRFQRASFSGKVEFRAIRCAGIAEFHKCVLAEGARFDEASFAAAVVLDSIEANGVMAFTKAVFAGTLSMVQASLQGEARFAGAQMAQARFDGTHFRASISFRAASFGHEASFAGCRFDESAGFADAAFNGPVLFSCARFEDVAVFDQAIFKHGADFRGARFSQDCTFNRARFEGPAEFSAVRAEAVFALSGACFAEVPDFRSTRFSSPPMLDHVRLGDPMRRFRRWQRGDAQPRDPRPILMRLMKVVGDDQVAARLRRLAQMAHAAQDYTREHAFRAQEMRASRFWYDKPAGSGSARFWLGWIYGGIANFGQSIWRPLALWLISVLAFALVYAGARDVPAAPAAQAVAPAWPRPLSLEAVVDWLGRLGGWLVEAIARLYTSTSCTDGAGNAASEALYLSLKTSFFFVPWESTQAAQRVYGCLYGFSETGSALVPLSVSLAGLAQSLVSLLLLVLIVLALRNVMRLR